MNSVAALGAAATVIATAFALCTIDRWTRHRKAHELAWSISLVMFALASAAYWWGAAAGWSIGVFRVFYLFGAILNVPYLAAGTIHLLAPAPPAHRCRRNLDIGAALCAAAAASRLRLTRLAITNTLIALGSLILGVGGALFTGPEAMTAFGIFLTVGISVLFAGFLVSSP